MSSLLLEQVPFYTVPLIFGAAFLLLKWYNSSPSPKNLPPSPPRLPIIGNLHQLKGDVHEVFLSLAKRYGDKNGLVMLYLGRTPTLVVTTTEVAHEIMKTHDIAFADRPNLRMFKAMSYNFKDVAVTPYGEHWRQVKSILTLHLLSYKTVQTYEVMRRRMIAGFVSDINQSFLSNTPVDIASMSFSITNDITCMSAFGRTYNDGEIGRKFKKLMKEISEVLATFYFEDAIPKQNLRN